MAILSIFLLVPLSGLIAAVYLLVALLRRQR
jgi:hypothetical protein